MQKDLTIGKPTTVLWKFCLPLFFSVIFQQLYNLADSFVAGKFIGESALAAIGNSYEITLIYTAISVGSNIGCSIIISRLFGAKKYQETKTAIYTSLISAIVISYILTLFGLMFTYNLLLMIDTPMDIFDASYTYLRIYTFGLPFVFFYNIANGIFSALGNSKTPLYLLAFSSISNIFADIYFVKFLNMGVRGIAIATVICQSISCILALAMVFKQIKAIECDEKPKYFSFDILKRIAVIAFPSIIQQSSISIGNIIIQGVINSFGSSVVAGYAAGVKLNNLVITSFTTIGNGISNYTSQNLGAQKYSRIKEGFKAGLKIVWTIAIPIMILYLTQSKSLIKLFIDNPTDVAIKTSCEFLYILVPFYVIIAIKLVSDGVLRGSGHMKDFILATMIDLGMRVILAKILSIPFGSIGIWYAWPVSWIVGTVLSYYFMRKIEY